MANTDDTSKKQDALTSGSDAIARFEQTIEAERARLLQVHSVLHCLYEVLLYADGEEASTYAEAAHLAAMLIDDAVARLDPVRLRPMLEAIQRTRMGSRDDDGSTVREPRVPFVYLSH